MRDLLVQSLRSRSVWRKGAGACLASKKGDEALKCLARIPVDSRVLWCLINMGCRRAVRFWRGGSEIALLAMIRGARGRIPLWDMLAMFVSSSKSVVG